MKFVRLLIFAPVVFILGFLLVLNSKATLAINNEQFYCNSPNGCYWCYWSSGSCIAHFEGPTCTGGTHAGDCSQFTSMQRCNNVVIDPGQNQQEFGGNACVSDATNKGTCTDGTKGCFWCDASGTIVDNTCKAGYITGSCPAGSSLANPQSCVPEEEVAECGQSVGANCCPSNKCEEGFGLACDISTLKCVPATEPTPSGGNICELAPNGAFGAYQNCTTIEIPETVFAAGQCKKEGVTPNTPYQVCCRQPLDACSVYNLRAPVCDSQDTSPAGPYGPENVRCLWQQWGLMCWGNNYRPVNVNQCTTDEPPFPVPNEFGGKYTGWLNGQGGTAETALTQNMEEAALFSSVTYNGFTYDGIGNKPVCVCSDAVIGGCQCPGVQVIVPEGGESRLWYPHLRLISALSTIAQAIFAPHPSYLKYNAPLQKGEASLKNTKITTSRIEKHQGVDDSTLVVNTTDNNSSLINNLVAPEANQLLSNTKDPYTDVACTIPEVINNPGDDLLGPEVTGRVLYTQKYTYQACPSDNCLPDGTIDVTDPGTCCSGNASGRSECYAAPIAQANGLYTCGTLGPVTFPTKGKAAVFIKNPLIEYVYDVMLAGDASLFKRFMPNQIGKKQEDIPSSVGYQVTAKANNQGDQPVSVLAADQPGNPVFYVPHTGSLKKYWLDDFQKALRPQGVEYSGEIPGSQTPAPTIDPISCEPIWEGVPLNGGWPAPIQAVINAAASKYGIPPCMLSGVASVEGSNMRNLTEFEARELTKKWTGAPEDNVSEALLAKVHCSANDAGARGPMQMLPGAFDPHKTASTSYLGAHTISVCNATDAIFAAASYLSSQLKEYGYSPNQGNSTARRYCAAGQTYYGSCQLDSPTCNNLGTNYCDFILNYCMDQQPGLNIPNSSQCSDYFDTSSKI